MKKLNNILSTFLVAALVLSVIQPMVFATDTSETSTNRAKISMVYMGLGSQTVKDLLNDTPTIQSTMPDTTDWVADAENGTVFWVGLSLSDMKKMDEATAKNGADASRLTYKSTLDGTEVTSHFTLYKNNDGYDFGSIGGIFNIISGIEYASKYVTPAFGAAGGILSKVMKRVDPRYAHYGFSTRAIASDIYADHDGVVKREENVIKAEDNPKLIYGMLAGDGLITDTIFGFTDDLDNDNLCIITVPFRLIEKPEPGTKLFQAALDPVYFIIQAGCIGSNSIWAAQWNANRTDPYSASFADGNLKNHFDYLGDLDFFPEAD